MGVKSETLANRFEVKVKEAMATLEKLSDTDWKKVTEAEKWSVGVTAHHVAGDLVPISEMIETVVAGKSLDFTMEMLDEMNAKHAKDHADCTRVETMDLMKKGVAVASAVVRKLTDEQLAKSASVFQGAPPMTVEQLITAALIDHADDHFGSIRKTVGK